jgi:hypothetical protein
MQGRDTPRVNMRGIYIHHLVAPGDLIAAKDRLAETLFAVRPGDRDRTLMISSTSGCFHFVDSANLWAGRGAGPRDGDAAEHAARDFVREANRRVRSSDISGLAATGIFPDEMRLVASQPVFSAPEDVDHWLYTYVGYLDTGIAPPSDQPAPSMTVRAPVIGAQIDVRIGEASQVVGMWSDWRPVRSAQLVEYLAKPGSDARQLVYEGGGHDDPIDVLAPYYLMGGEDEDTGTLSSASAYSLSIAVAREDNSKGVLLTALVTGNTGSVTFSWGAWPLDTGPVGQFERRSDSDSVELPTGAYNVVLDVEDQLTGAFARSQYLIYCGPAAPESD